MKWISVNDRLPKKREDVLCLFQDEQRKRKHIEISWMDSVGCFLYENIYGKVTHWMPLPYPPKEGEQ